MASAGARSISAEQGMPGRLDLLAAQAWLYSDAKRLRLNRVAVTLVVAVPLPVLAVLLPATQPFVASVGGVWLVIAFMVQFGFERGKVAKATRVLEQFDVEVFGLEWNSRLVGKRVAPEVVAAAARRYGSKRDRLNDWYPVVADDLPYPILCCYANAPQ